MKRVTSIQVPKNNRREKSDTRKPLRMIVAWMMVLSMMMAIVVPSFAAGEGVGQPAAEPVLVEQAVEETQPEVTPEQTVEVPENPQPSEPAEEAAEQTTQPEQTVEPTVQPEQTVEPTVQPEQPAAEPAAQPEAAAQPHTCSDMTPEELGSYLDGLDEAARAAVLEELELLKLNDEQICVLAEHLTAEELNDLVGKLDDEQYEAFMALLSETTLLALSAKMQDEPQVLALTPTGDYVGFTKITYDRSGTRVADVAYITTNLFASRYYVTTRANFEKYKTSSTDSQVVLDKQNQLLQHSSVAYCYNRLRKSPEAYRNSSVSYYGSKVDATARDFYNRTGNSKGVSQARVGADLLYQHIMSIGMCGYPTNYTDIQGRYGLSDDAFLVITQMAIWYYTDSLNLASTRFATIPQYNAYVELLNTVLPSNLINRVGHLYLFPSLDAEYQHMFAVDMTAYVEPSSVEVQLEADKTLTGATLTAGQFTFQLKENDTKTKWTATNDENGHITFNSITFDEDGTYTYTITEVNDRQQGITYDTSKWYAEVVISGNATEAEVTYYNSKNKAVDGVTFANTYTPATPSAPVFAQVNITASKTLEGGNLADYAGQFEFELLDAEGNLVKKATADANGRIDFGSFTFEQAGTYVYKIREVEGSLSNIRYDTTERTVTVTVTEDSSGSSMPNISTTDPYYSYRVDGTDVMALSTTFGGDDIRAYCTDIDRQGPYYQRGWSPATEDDTYHAVINPTLSQIKNKNLVSNAKDANLIQHMKQVLYFFETEDVSKFSPEDKTTLVQVVGGRTGADGNYLKGNLKTVRETLNWIYANITPPSNYTLVFFQADHTSGRKSNHDEYVTQPLVAGFGGGASFTAAVDQVPTFTNVKEELCGLTVSKTVTGNVGEQNREFNFTVTAASSTVNGTYEVIGNADFNQLTFVNGKAEFKLKHGEEITVTNLPKMNYTVNEAEFNQDGYQSTVNVTEGENGKVFDFINDREVLLGLSVSKTVTGNMGERDREFSFTVTAESNTVNGTYEVTGNAGITQLTFVNGKAEFKLKHGEEITVTNLPKMSYTVNEAEFNQDGYTSTVDRSEDENGKYFDFVNEREQPVPTGVSLESAPAVIAMLAAAAGAWLLLRGRKNRD